MQLFLRKQHTKGKTLSIPKRKTKFLLFSDCKFAQKHKKLKLKFYKI